MRQVIQGIQERLAKQVPALRYVDQDWGQMDFFAPPPVKFPCALIDIQSAQYTNNGDLVQQGTLTVVVRMFDMRLSNSSQKAPDRQKENVMLIWQLIGDVNKALHGQRFLGVGYGVPMRWQMRRVKREDGCYQTELYYTIQFTDTATEPALTPVLGVAASVRTVSFKKT